MHKTIKYTLCFAICIFLSACAKTLDDIDANSEVVNGFCVSWRKNVTENQKEAIRDILNDMHLVEGGTFLMGATQEQEPFAKDNEKPAHYVQLSDFYICKYEISISQLESILNKEFTPYNKLCGTPQFSWYDWRYVIDLICELSGIEVDFPTEAQWEYAARGGNKSKGYIYSGGNSLEVAELSENELGLCEMARCHSEWCKDAFNYYSQLPLEINPYCVQGLGHVVRGGNAKSLEKQKDYFSTLSTKDKFINSYDDIRCCRVSARSYDTQSSLNRYISCRLVINIKND